MIYSLSSKMLNPTLSVYLCLFIFIWLELNAASHLAINYCYRVEYFNFV